MKESTLAIAPSLVVGFLSGRSSAFVYHFIG